MVARHYWKNGVTRGRLRLRLVEFHVVHHCNLRCRGCAHFSPSAQPWHITPGELMSDVTLAGNRLDPIYVHILGGEPLLHAHLAHLIPIFREAFPQSTMKLVTNGVLLHHSSPALLDTLAHNRVILAVSLYPDVALSKREIVNLCADRAVPTEFWNQQTFLDFIDPTGTSDPKRARATCPMADACNVRAGRLYPCPVSAWADLGGLDWNPEDGVPLTAPISKIRKRVSRANTTSCCKYCRTSPARIPHRMLPTQEREARHKHA